MELHFLNVVDVVSGCIVNHHVETVHGLEQSHLAASFCVPYTLGDVALQSQLACEDVRYHRGFGVGRGVEYYGLCADEHGTAI